MRRASGARRIVSSRFHVLTVHQCCPRASRDYVVSPSGAAARRSTDLPECVAPSHFRSSGGERQLPDLVASLDGQVHLNVVGFVDSVHKKGAEVSRTRNTFAMVPDAPVSKFVLSLKGGRGAFCRTAPPMQGKTRRSGRVPGRRARFLTSSRRSRMAECGGKAPRKGGHRAEGRFGADRAGSLRLRRGRPKKSRSSRLPLAWTGGGQATPARGTPSVAGCGSTTSDGSVGHGRESCVSARATEAAAFAAAGLASCASLSDFLLDAAGRPTASDSAFCVTGTLANRSPPVALARPPG
jgi:hypothetical protein